MSSDINNLRIFVVWLVSIPWFSMEIPWDNQRNIREQIKEYMTTYIRYMST
tara:strand:+ start:213 stop:365 length:153 start_codon:yes stop_codon:yes gene_type:complete